LLYFVVGVFVRFRAASCYILQGESLVTESYVAIDDSQPRADPLQQIYRFARTIALVKRPANLSEPLSVRSRLIIKKVLNGKESSQGERERRNIY
jgi:hypothetical protein